MQLMTKIVYLTYLQLRRSYVTRKLDPVSNNIKSVISINNAQHQQNQTHQVGLILSYQSKRHLSVLPSFTELFVKKVF